MRSIPELVGALRQAKIRVWSDGDQLRYRAPAGALTLELRTEMKERKGELLEFCRQARPERQVPLIPIPRNGSLPISLSQQRLWLLQQIEGPSPTYNVAQALQLTGELDLDALRLSLGEIVRRHEVLRSTFLLDEDEVRQRIVPYSPLELPVVDLRDLPPEAQLAEVHRQACVESLRVFDLSSGPLARFMIWRLGDERHVLQLTLHHIISDGTSLAVFTQELASLYEAFSQGQQPRLPELAIQYADFAAWQRSAQDEGLQATELEYWRRQLRDLPPLLELPLDRPRPRTQTSSGAFHRVMIDTPLLSSLKQAATGVGSTLYASLLAALSVVLSRYTGRTDIPLGCPVSNRDRPETERLIGFFINTLVLRLDLSGDPSLVELLERAKKVLFEGMAHQNLPFEKVVEALVTDRSTSYSPLVQVTAMLLDGESMRLELPGLQVEPFEVEQPVARFDLALEMYERRDGVHVIWIYNSDLFDEATVARMAGHFLKVLEQLASNPASRLSELQLLSTDEQQLLLVGWNDTTADYPRSQCVQQLFEEQAAQAPESVAVQFEDQQLTYAELDARANRLAHHLIKLGVGPDVLVGICLERSLEVVVGLLGILKAGGAYVPLDPSYPQDRLGFMIDDAQISVLLTDSKVEPQLPAHRATALRLDDGWERMALESSESPTTTVGPRNLVYVIYTSGSTGKPKGTLLEHRNVVNYLAWARRFYKVAGGCGAPVNTPLGFDATVTSLLTPLVSGRTVTLLPEAEELDHLSQALQSDQDFSLVKLTPSHLDAMRRGLAKQAAGGRARAYVIGGEALTGSQLAYWREFAPHVRMVNEYGPTEATVGCCVYEVPQDELPAENVPIGRPIANTQLYVLDRDRQPLPIGVPGELYIGGAGVARGYLNRPELTAERFIADPFHTDPSSRLYKTGDLCRWLPDGNLEFLGRIDQQVKIRGFRIELGEIEAALTAHGRIREAVVLDREWSTGGKRLVAYVVASTVGGNGHAKAVSANELRQHLKASLPEYMVPSAFVFLDELPLTPNGKVDRRALPSPAGRFELEQQYQPPRSPQEDKLTAIWQQVLGLERVGVEDNFFELGGDSILSIQVVSRASEQGLRLTARQLFEHQTIAALARVAETRVQLEAEQGLVQGEAPLTPIQHWFFEQQLEDIQHWNQALRLSLHGLLPLATLERAVERLLEQHDVLRLRFQQQGDGVWQQSFGESPDSRVVEQVDLSAFEREQQAIQIEKHANAAQESLDLGAGPVLRVVLFDAGTDRPAQLLIVIHHLAVDGVSWRILLEDLGRLCQQIEAGQPLELPAKTTSFRQWSERLQEFAQGEQALAELDYWREVGRQPVSEVPVDRRGGENTVASSERVVVTLSEEQTEILLRQVPQAYQTQINDVLLTALLRAYASWTGHDCLRLDLEGHGREELFDDLDISRTVGWFTTVFPVSLALPEEDSLSASLQSVKEQLRGVPQRGIGYGLLRYLCEEPSAAGLRELDDAAVSFNYLGQFEVSGSGSEDSLGRLATETAGLARSPHGQRRHLIDITGMVSDGRLQVDWTYCREIHDRTTIEAWAAGFQEALQELITYCVSPEAGGYTPSDFPLSELNQNQLDRVISPEQARDKTIEDVYPLTPTQQGMAYHTLREPSSGVYYEQLAVELEGPLEIDAFRQAWRQMQARHAVLRTTLVWQGVPRMLQVVHQQQPLPWSFQDWSTHSPGKQQQDLDQHLKSARAAGFDLENGPLWEIELIRLAESCWVFIFSSHHVLWDGWSFPVVISEALQAYQAALTGNEWSLPAVRPYRDYITWLSQQDREAAETFWRDELTGLTAATPLVVERQRSDAGPGQREVKVQLGQATTRQLGQFARRQRVTFNTLVQGAWALLWSRYSGEEDVVFGATTSGRPAELTGVEQMVGLFINTLPVRVRVPTEEQVATWLSELQDRQALGRQFEHCSLVDIQGWSEVPAGSPLFETLVVFENYPLEEQLQTSTWGDLRFGAVQSHEQTNYPLTLAVVPGEQLTLLLKYDQSRFEQAVVERLLGHFQTLLLGIASNPECKLAELPILTRAEHQQVLLQWNETTTDYPRHQGIHQLFEEQVGRTPSAVAAVFGDQQLTYAELNHRANQLASSLRDRGVETGELVGLFVDRSLDMLVGMVGILKAGAAYVPLDTAYPKQRLALMLDDCRAKVLLTQEHLRELLPAHDVDVVCLDSGWAEIGQQPADNLEIAVAGEGLAYVIYTSGSTGVPKGVVVRHQAVNRLVLQTDYIDLMPSDVVAQASNASFDAATFEIWGALLNGAKLAGIERNVSLAPDLFADALHKFEVTTLFLTTALFNQLSREAPGAFGRLRHLLFGGELVDPDCVRAVLRDGPPERLLHVYGPTENTTFSTWHHVEEVAENAVTVPIGKPIANTQQYVLDDRRQPVPVGVPGELYLGGDGLAEEYLYRPELTAERFVDNPFDPGSRLYRTGDIVCWLPDGTVEFLGRRDDQVKIRGFRIELGEIEAALLRQTDVQEAVVLAPVNERGELELAAYVVLPPASSLEAGSLRDELARELPNYMVPARYSFLDSFPLNVNGKVDRAKLPPPAAPLSKRYTPPRTETERTLAAIFAEVLGVADVGVEDNFFELGGHSLVATQVVSRVRESFSMELPLRSLFESPTVAGLAERIGAGRNPSADENQVIPRAERAGPAALSFAQERLWFLDQLEPGNPFYNVPSALSLKGKLSVAALEGSLHQVVRRHEVLRGRYPEADGNPSQVFVHELSVPVPIVDLSHLPDEARSQEVQRRVQEEARLPFELAAGPLIRAQLLRLAPEDHVLLFTMHHIVSDGWSLGVLIDEVMHLYRDCLSPADANTPDLPELPIQYADFAAWQRDWLSGETLDKQLSYWKQQLAGVPPVLELPTDKPRPPVQSYRGSSVKFAVDSATTAGLRRLSADKEATLFMTLLGAWAVLLYRYSGQDDIVIGSPIANRNRREIESLIGFFVNTLALRVDLKGNPAFAEVVGQVRQMALDAYTHQDLPFERLVDEVQPERDLSLNPLFQVMFTLQNMPANALELPNLKVDLVETTSVAALFDLVLDMWEVDDSLIGVLEYNTDLFDAVGIDKLVASFQTLLRELATTPTLRIDEIPLLTTDRQEHMLSLGQGPKKLYPVDSTLDELFEESAERCADRVAVAHNGRYVSYADLNSQANQIAHWLRGQGVGRGDFVGILLPRSPECLAALLGTLKAGGAFLPIDPAYPADRIQYMLTDSRPRTLISNTKTMADVFPAGSDVVQPRLLDLTSGALTSQPATNLDRVTSAEDVAYLLYTSGSTGLPKGAMVRHNGAVNHIFAEFELLGFHADSAFLQSAPSSSDISVWQFLAPVMIGGKTVVADYETVCDPSRLFETIKSEAVTLIELVPVVMNELLEYAAGLPESQRRLCDLATAMITGEAAPVAVVNRWLELYPGIPLVNAYGPTEAADDICQHVVDQPLPTEARSVPIGRPLANLSLYVLDRGLRLVPPGVPGEICVAGIGVGTGYWNNEKKTAQSFVPNPYSSNDSDRVLYRTGDLGRWLSDGTLECLARIDEQVKVRGFRIETGEIEAVLGSHPAVHEAAVIVREDTPGDRRLAAYFVPQESSAAVKKRLSQLQHDQISLWQDLHEDSYVETLDYDDPTFNVIGWDSNYTGQPLPRKDMHEYVDFTVERIRSLKPRRVLEIGAGTGLIMFPLLPHVESYLGTDLSQVAVRRLQELLQSAAVCERLPDAAKAQVQQRRADDLEWLEPHSFDTVIFPSVVQYFPGVDYLRLVLGRLIERIIEPGGAIFLGDVRSLPLLKAFHASVQLYKADSGMPAGELAENVQSQLMSEQEMAIDPEFFLRLANEVPQIERVEILPKRGRQMNEMTRFRYDVLLHLAGDASQTTKPAAACDWIDWREDNPSSDELRRKLAEERPAVLAYRQVANSRVADALQTLRWLSRGTGTAGELKDTLQADSPSGLDPEELWALSADLDYDVQMSMAGASDDGSFDLLLTRRNVEHTACFGTRQLSPTRRHANNPLREKLAHGLAADLREFLQAKLPNYMVPSDMTMLDELPLTPAGKVDRGSLPRPARSARATDDYVAPRTPQEEVICRIWEEVLSLERVGVRDNFFALGGHSLKATQAVSRIHRELSVEIALRDIFARPTVEQLAEGLHGRSESRAESIPRVPDADHYELSHAQRRLWVLSQMEDGLAAYNMPIALVLDGDVDPEVFRRALDALVERHESLRTAFVAIGGKPRQQVLTDCQAALRVLDLTGEPDPEARARELAQADAAEPFDLQSGVLLRATLLKLSTDRHGLLFNIHHIVSDEWSMHVLVGEFVQLYAAYRDNQSSPLEPLAIQYRDYAVWQNQYLAGDESAADRDYWLARFSGNLPLLDLPADHRRPTVKTYRGRAIPWRLDEPQTAALEKISRERGASLFMTFVALLDTLLYRYTGQEDIIVGFPIAGRDHEDLESQIGFFVNTLPLRVGLEGDLPFEAVLDRVKAAATEAYEHQAYPFDRLVDELQVARDASRHPLFDVVAAMLNDPPEELSLDGVRISGLVEEYEGSKFDLQFIFEPRDGWVEGTIVYNTDLFSHARIERMRRHFLQLVESVVEDAAQTVERLGILTLDEQQQLLEFNPQPQAFDCPRTLVEMFEAQVACNPGEVALVWPGEERTSLSYAALNARANQLAHHLRDLGVGPNDLVGLCLERSLDTVVAILGVLKAGAAYVPFDTAHPPQRLQFMLEDARTEVLVTRQEFAQAPAVKPRHLVCLDTDREQLSRHPLDNPPVAAVPTDTAYVIYTSGSTGQPKGVPVSHYNVSRLFAATDSWFHFGPEDVWTLFHSYAFDFSVWEIWGALLHGGRLLVVPQETTRSPDAFYELLASERVTVLNQTPSAFRQLVQLEGRRDSHHAFDLRLVIFGGEALDLSSLQPWFDRHGDEQPRLVNMYGITETTVHVTYRPITSDDVHEAASLIGEPIPDLRVRLLDDELNPVPIGVPGEICVGGAGVAGGYLNRPELTSRRFVPDPTDPAAKLYRSGDLGRYREDGDIEYLGRLDDQIQIRGFRVELGEIAATLSQHPSVHDAVVIAQDFAGSPRLLAYIIAAVEAADGESQKLDAASLRQHLRDQLPDYMVPAAFIPVDSFPLTANGKLDTKSLPAPEDEELGVSAPFIAPRNDLEQQVAGVFAQFLQRDKIGVDDNFFDLGVNSLLLVEVNNHLRDTLSRDVPIVWMFQYPTVRALAEQLAPRDQQGSSVVDKAKERAAQQRQARRRRRR